MAVDPQLAIKTESKDWWSVHRGDAPIVGTAIHNGHEVRKSFEKKMAIDEDEREREEDPFTEFIIRDVPNRISTGNQHWHLFHASPEMGLYR